MADSELTSEQRGITEETAADSRAEQFGDWLRASVDSQTPDEIARWQESRDRVGETDRRLRSQLPDATSPEILLARMSEGDQAIVERVIEIEEQSERIARIMGGRRRLRMIVITDRIGST